MRKKARAHTPPTKYTRFNQTLFLSDLLIISKFTERKTKNEMPLWLCCVCIHSSHLYTRAFCRAFTIFVSIRIFSKFRVIRHYSLPFIFIRLSILISNLYIAWNSHLCITVVAFVRISRSTKCCCFCCCCCY